MKALIEEIGQIPEVRDLIHAVRHKGCRAAVTGLAPVHRAAVAAALMRAANRPMLMLCADEMQARRMAADLGSAAAVDPVFLPAREMQFYDVSASREWEHRRIEALWRIAQGDAPLIVTTPEALIGRAIPKRILRENTVVLTADDSIDPEALGERLTQMGYVRCTQVEGVGQYALRGGIVDIFGPGMDLPVRVEFFGDAVDAMGVFDAATQRRIRNIKRTVILPACEILPASFEGGTAALAARIEAAAKKYEKREKAIVQTLRRDAEVLRQNAMMGTLERYAALIDPEFSAPFDYLAEDCIVCVSDAPRIDECVKTLCRQKTEDTRMLIESGILAGEWARIALTENEFWEKTGERCVCFLSSLPTSRYPLAPTELFQVTAKQLSSYGGSLETALSDLEQYRSTDFRVLVLCGSELRARNMARFLEEHGVRVTLDFALTSIAPGIQLSIGALSAGAEYPQISLAVLTEGQLTDAPKKKHASAKSNRRKLQSYTDLSPGDLVVHVHHGIGRFVGMQKMRVNNMMRDYVKIAYAGSDCLYVSATQLDLISKYIGGGDDAAPRKLNKLGGTEWKKSKSRAKAAVKDLAKGLIRLYAERAKKKGFAFSPDSPWQREFEEAFPYVETEDQLRCIAEIKRDMERPVPMDRLLCGDVGYGKTEVALRAIMKCVLDGKQAAILVPTTVLAQQHYATASNRFRAFPVNIAILSRFQTQAQSKKIMEQLKSGAIDLLIGTHRLLQKNVVFKDLGLLVIDEEQRFGVTHKEKLKELSRQVDVLTLTATPIPRTLNMALSGVRDMSTLEAPPQDRHPVQTYVMEHDMTFLCDAMRREIGRGGQVYYLHNRVETIDRTAAKIRDLLGDEVQVSAAHGRLNEQQLSAVMQSVIDGQTQVLVCTTIIETGIDIPNVNTLIIEDADRLGLAQLHQIRGRIGRSARRAYAYLTFRRGKILSETADKRLSAIREYVEFGSGFRIAMRDLEIRGAGNLLGPEQSGFLMSVGYDMYLQLLEEAVQEEQGVESHSARECSVDLDIGANIPDRYVPSAQQRMDLYRRIAALRTREEADDLLDELIDRFGDPPSAVTVLLDIALLRGDAARFGVTEITQKGDTVRFLLGDVDPTALVGVCGMRKYRDTLRLNAGSAPSLTLKLPPKSDTVALCRDLIDALGSAAVQTAQATQ